MSTKQTQIVLPEFSKGFHLITDLILNALPPLPDEGVLHLFIKHTSAGLTLNENADPTVRLDFESWFTANIKDNEPYYRHNYEGSDDMPAHIKSSLVGHSVSIPISSGKLNMGIWQGIYLCDFRNHGGRRKLVATVL